MKNIITGIKTFSAIILIFQIIFSQSFIVYAQEGTGSVSGTGEKVNSESQIPCSSTGGVISESGSIVTGTGINQECDSKSDIGETTQAGETTQIGGIEEANAFLYSKYKRSTILEEFKDNEREMIFEQDDFLDEEDLKILQSNDKIKVFDKIREKMMEKRKEYEVEKDKMTQKKVTLNQTIDDLDNSVSETIEGIKMVDYQVAILGNEIEISRNAIEGVKGKINKNKLVLIDYVIHIYKKSNSIYSGDEVDSIKSILLNGGSLGDILSDFHLKNILEITGQRLITKHRELIKDLFAQQLALGKKKVLVENLKTDLEQSIKSIEEKKRYKKKLLEVTEGKETLFQKYISDKLRKEGKLKIRVIGERMRYNSLRHKLAKKYNCPNLYFKMNIGDDEISQILEEKCIKYEKAFLAESLLHKTETSTGGKVNRFIWPVKPGNGLTAFYHDPEYAITMGSDHEGIDIRVDQGTDIRTVADGYVVYIQEPSAPGYYGYIAVKHRDGYVSVYGHVSEVLVKQYDYLRQGKVLAKSGGTPGTNGAGILTSGPHLHFEVFQDKSYKDPLNFLDLTQLRLKFIPSDRYISKYYDDLKRKYGKNVRFRKDTLTILKLEGESEVERQKSLLKKYAVGDFRNWNLWIEEALDGSIDPTFVMCIGLAETSLGRRLKTSYNIGNVGNTDSGSTYDFPNARSGIYWIIKTLNNKYLDKYEKVSELSRFGNQDGSVYASSSIHWHNNVVKCMSAVKQRHITDDHQFRMKFGR